MAASTNSQATQSVGPPRDAQIDIALPTELAASLLAPEARTKILEWSGERAASVVATLKEGADRQWLIDPNASLQMADAIVLIGRVRADPLCTALGMMARGDALKYLGSAREAWEAFQQAGVAFQAAGDDVGWARTRIGMLVVSASINTVESALSDATQARAIFLRHAQFDLLTRLDINLALVYSWIGDPQRSLFHGDEALRRAEPQGSPSRQFLGLIYTNCGSVHANLLGDYRAALAYFRKAKAFAEERQDTKNVALAELDIAYVATQQGRFREALRLLRHAREVYADQHLALDTTHVDREIVECYLQLCRFEEARDLARNVVEQYRRCGEGNYEAHALLNLAVASAELGEYASARAALDEAEALFRSLHASSWAANARLRRGRLMLRQGDAAGALAEAEGAAEQFASAGHPLQYAAASVLRAESLLDLSRPHEAADAARAALVTAKQSGAALLRYSAHLALGRIAEHERLSTHAMRHYRAAIAAVDRVRRDLTITLRPGFLEDKGQALQALMGLLLRGGDTLGAFETLERAKSQPHIEYATNRRQLHWASSSQQNGDLLVEFEALRDRHQWLYNLANVDPESQEGRRQALSKADAMRELVLNERRMRAVTEQLYLNAGEDQLAQRASAPALREVQKRLEGDSALVEYYHDGARLYAFVVDRVSITVEPLTLPLGTVERLLAQLQMNCAAVLRQGPHAAAARVLRLSALRLLEQLHDCLLAPVRNRFGASRRLYIVPFGALHYVPFHLLRAENRYLLEEFEVVILPAAGLLTRPRLERPAGARIVAHSANGYLPQVLAEADMLGAVLACEPFVEGAANRQAFDGTPLQILHVAAHAAFRLDQPAFSYIELADGQLFADDLMQHDLSYELVTLSACETGRSHIAARDECIGLGRGFLYAGAGALIASLWRVGDEIALPLMRDLYGALLSGRSKACALRSAQMAMLAAAPEMHPAFWGAFQLLGDARPLSRTPVAPGQYADEEN